MLPSRGLVRPSQALRLRTGTRNFGTRRMVGGTSTTIAQLSGRRVTVAPSASTARISINNNLPSTAAAFSLWPFSRKASPAPDAAAQSAEPAAAAAAASPATTPVPEPAAAAATPPPPPTAAADPVLSATSDTTTAAASSTSSTSSISSADDAAALTELLDGSALLDMSSDQLGYLHALGLDYGWGPTSMCQWAVEHVHVYTGLPWWASVLAATVLFRAAIFMPSLTAAEHSAKIQLLRSDPAYAKAMEDMQTAAFRGGGGGNSQMKAMEARLKLKQMQKDANVSTYKMFVPMINVPFGYGMFRLLRGMATLSVPELEDGGLLWFQDLTVPDPYFLLPLGSAGIMYVIFRANMKYMAPQMQSMMKMMQMVITPISVILTARMASLLTFFFLTSSFLQMLQTALWHQPWLRRWKGLPPMEQMIAGGTLNAAGNAASSAAGVRSSIPASYRLEPGSNWQAPRTVSQQQQQQSSTAAAAAAAAQPPSAVDVVKQGWNKMMGQAKDKQKDMSTKDIFAKADLFEKKRTVEDEEGLYRRREAERQYREMKKAMAKSSGSPKN
ncbi:mitochondrial export translocase oxa1 [Ophiostoma piceae UAMH 11346]|uniref:Mitochondrial export translocase oxa1 n=1 Tax=Ophiostoma piceae (strain UAMH 11346) TaxID=1262450 RepID=S3D506_OPHP1|nr:mitochondrial export translocase oxa1 [Ophiostoma piceae UAMH 11346]